MIPTRQMFGENSQCCRCVLRRCVSALLAGIKLSCVRRWSLDKFECLMIFCHACSFRLYLAGTTLVKLPSELATRNWHIRYCPMIIDAEAVLGRPLHRICRCACLWRVSTLVCSFRCFRVEVMGQSSSSSCSSSLNVAICVQAFKVAISVDPHHAESFNNLGVRVCAIFYRSFAPV